MTVDERLGEVEHRLEGLTGEVAALRGEVGGLRGEVGDLRGEVSGLRGEVNGLRVLYEDHSSQICAIAEVQAHHGAALAQIQRSLEPLARIDAFIQTVAADHERRIQALERDRGTPR
jgi:archaellum component FlaC